MSLSKKKQPEGTGSERPDDLTRMIHNKLKVDCQKGKLMTWKQQGKMKTRNCFISTFLKKPCGQIMFVTYIFVREQSSFVWYDKNESFKEFTLPTVVLQATCTTGEYNVWRILEFMLRTMVLKLSCFGRMLLQDRQSAGQSPCPGWHRQSNSRATTVFMLLLSSVKQNRQKQNGWN